MLVVTNSCKFIGMNKIEREIINLFQPTVLEIIIYIQMLQAAQKPSMDFPEILLPPVHIVIKNVVYA